MRYIQFLTKLQAALGDGQGVDAIAPELTAEETTYLAKNASRLPTLGGMEFYLDQLAGLLDIPPAAVTSNEERDREIAHLLPEIWAKAENKAAPVMHPAHTLHKEAEQQDVLTNKAGEPIAKCTGCMSEKGNFVFNAWQRLSPTYDKMCEPFLLAGAVQAMKADERIERVTLGTNKAGAEFPPAANPETPAKRELASADANMQYEVLTRDKLPFVQTKLQIMDRGTGKSIAADLRPLDTLAWQQRTSSEPIQSGSRER